MQSDLKRAFRPEFLNRVDEVIVFETLSREQIRQIVDLQVKRLFANLSDKGLTIELNDASRDWLAEKGYDPDFGARPLKRVMMRAIESPLSMRLLAGEFVEGDTILVGVSENGEDLTFRKKEMSLKKA